MGCNSQQKKAERLGSEHTQHECRTGFLDVFGEGELGNTTSGQLSFTVNAAFAERDGKKDFAQCIDNNELYKHTYNIATT